MKPVVGGVHLSLTNKTKPFLPDIALYLRMCFRYPLSHAASMLYACVTSRRQYLFGDTDVGGLFCHNTFSLMNQKISGSKLHVADILFDIVFVSIYETANKLYLFTTLRKL